MKIWPIALAFALVGCTSVTLKSGDNAMSGSLLNGSMSLSSGAGCSPVESNPQVAPPPLPAPFRARRLCDANGANCQSALVADTTPTCVTQVATVKSTDFGGYAQWGLAGLAGIALLVMSGS